MAKKKKKKYFVLIQVYRQFKTDRIWKLGAGGVNQQSTKEFESSQSRIHHSNFRDVSRLWRTFALLLLSLRMESK